MVYMVYQLESPDITTIIDYCEDLLKDEKIEVYDFGKRRDCDLVYQSDDSSFDMLSGHGIDSILNVTDTVMDLCRDY